MVGGKGKLNFINCVAHAHIIRVVPSYVCLSLMKCVL